MTFIFSCFIIIVISLCPILIVLAIFISIKPGHEESIDSSRFDGSSSRSLYFGHRWMDEFDD